MPPVQGAVSSNVSSARIVSTPASLHMQHLELQTAGVLQLVNAMLCAGNQILGRHGLTHAQVEGLCACFYSLCERQPAQGQHSTRGHAAAG